jgi:hypothetical protein
MLRVLVAEYHAALIPHGIATLAGLARPDILGHE